MMLYADTGFVCSLYAPDAHTERAIRAVEKTGGPFAYNWLHQIESRNAFRLHVFRREITSAQRNDSLNHFMADLHAGLFTSVNAPQTDVLLEAERLSALYTEKLGVRSLDVLHVALCLVSGCKRFHSFDVPQAGLAKKAGLTVAAI